MSELVRFMIYADSSSGWHTKKHERGAWVRYEDVAALTSNRDYWRGRYEHAKEEIAALTAQLASLVDLEAGYRQSEQVMRRRLSDALTGGTAETWEDVATAASTLTAALAEAHRERDALKAEMRVTPESAVNLLRINREYAERCEAETKAAQAEATALREALAKAYAKAEAKGWISALEACARALEAGADAGGRQTETGRVLSSSADKFRRQATRLAAECAGGQPPTGGQ